MLIDVIGGRGRWAGWSSTALHALAETTRLVVNPLIYAEISVGFDSIEAVEDVIPPTLLAREPLPYEAAFLAGKAFARYRQRGGTRRSPLPDFYIGAHAAVSGYRLITRDARRYREYFPRLELIAPA